MSHPVAGVPPVVGSGEPVRVDGFPGISKLPNPEGEDFPDSGATELEVLIQGVFDKRRIRELIQHFIVFESTKTDINKKFICRRFCTIYPKREVQH